MQFSLGHVSKRAPSMGKRACVPFQKALMAQETMAKVNNQQREETIQKEIAVEKEKIPNQSENKIMNRKSMEQ